MAEEADIQAGHRVLEPSAGTGNLIIAIKELGFNGNIHLDAIEINYDLCKKLRGYGIEVDQQDFLEVEKPYCPDAPDGWDRIVMNPPFVNGADIKHIQHAQTLLKPGGRLVALCANGPRQRAALQPIADIWEDLPAGSFKEQGTNVSVALLVINAPEAPAEGQLF
jgi:16S rRNA G1207 methylase RsmC